MRTTPRAASLLSLAAALLGCSSSETQPPAPTPDAGPPPVMKPAAIPVPPVFIGSGGFAYAFGSSFAGATAPQGLAKVGPDTKGPWGTASFLHYSGYWYGDDTVQGFSHLHLHGTGATDYGLISLMPSDGFDASRTTPKGYESHFDKKSEMGTPGRYGVTLDRGAIQVELTARAHVALHRYTYPPSAMTGQVILDLDHHLSGGSITDASITASPDEKRLRGKVHSMGGMSKGFGGYDVFFEIRSRTGWTGTQVWSAGNKPAPGTMATGTGVGVALAYDLADHAPIELQVGLSLVSSEAAAKNLDAETPTFAFDATAKQTAADWESLLGAVKVTGGTEDQRNMVTAAVYHAFLMPTIQSDTDGAYRGMDGQVHQASGFNYLSDLSLWDTYRTLHPLYAIIAPDRDRDSVLSLHQKAKEGGFFPKWPIAIGEAGTMIGSSAEVVLADAWIKGIKGFDAEGAYAMLRAAAMDPVAPAGGRGGRNDVESYMKLGYVPASSGSSVSITTEYASDDLALAELAEGLGHQDDAAALRARAKGYLKLFDPDTGFLWARNADGTWASDHSDPTNFSDEFDEANAFQSLWMVARDIESLAVASGGREPLIARLVTLFEKGKEDFDQLDPTDPLKSAGMRPYYWGGNEPDMHAAYLFAQLGRPDLCQKWVAWSRESLFGPGADGLPGNDDGGTMSAWYLFSALGFYPLPGSDRYVIGSPLFPHAELRVPGGGTFTVEAEGVSATNIYVQSVTLNGAALITPELRHADLKSGGTLAFTMGPSPSSWGKSGM